VAGRTRPERAARKVRPLRRCSRPATVRSRAASTSAIHAGGCSPLPTSSRLPDQVADHVVQESVGLELEIEEFTRPRPELDAGEVAHRRARLTGDGAETAEVLLADQAATGRLHRLVIERQTNPGQAFAPDRRAHETVDDGVAIPPRLRGKTRMEIVGHGHHPARYRGLRQMRIGAEQPGAFDTLRVAVEVHDLEGRVHAGVGAAGGPSPRSDGERLSRSRPPASTAR
jgi:hypothetical protein